MQNQLYDRDFNLWVEEMAIALRNRDIKAMDWNNLLEEIEDLGKSEKRSLESYLERLVEHILKLKYWRATPRRLQAFTQLRVLGKGTREMKLRKNEITNIGKLR